MCGIAGILGPVTPDDHDRVRRMTQMLRHRGPNAIRSTVHSGAVLGHTRLSIIDLSDRGLQPMTSADGRHVMVFNGEIYNYRELRADLARDTRFQSASDSEVLLAAYRRWGADCLDRLIGMFAFCIFDTVEHTAFFARDRFGQKPLFFAEQHGKLLFASEIKPLLAAGVPATSDAATWARYLRHASYDDGPATYFAGISQLEPGECADYAEPGRLVRRRYYDVAATISEPQVTRAQAPAAVRECLVDAARLHMRSDVPVGVSLSGGLDSSALLATIDLAGELHDGVQCVSVDFGGDLTERPWIEAAADHHGLQAHIVGYTPQDFRADITPMMWQLEGPLGGLMNCALGAVMAHAQQCGITVIQDGTGLDEAFGGYRNHHNLYLGRLIAAQDPAADTALRDYARNWQVSEAQARSDGLAALHAKSTAIDGTSLVNEKVLHPRLRNVENAATVPTPTGDPLRDAFVDYLQVRKIPRNTRMKDRLSMAYGLELRLPFLDHRLVELALSLPADLLFLHGRSKSILREALTGAMAEDVRLAAKRSIQAPQGDWLRRQPMRGYVQDLIASQSFADRGLFDVAAARTAFAEFVDGAYDNSFFVWQWINVEAWHRIFIDGDPIATQTPLHPGIWTAEPAGSLAAVGG